MLVRRLFLSLPVNLIFVCISNLNIRRDARPCVSNQILGGNVSNQILGGNASNQILGGNVSNQILGGNASNQILGGRDARPCVSTLFFASLHYF
jgi:hypothetical protein